jgi:exopolyphosphatase/guanosine-5'-triphosphate,3'-diphosphate pyrophosphatase
MEGGDVEDMVRLLVQHSVKDRSRLDGVSEERADIIIPGLMILQTVYRHIRAAGYVISGSGLREGVYYETVSPDHPYADDLVDNSIQGLLRQFTSVPLAHAGHVDKLALRIYDGLGADRIFDKRSRILLHTAALLHRIGTAVSYYTHHSHTFYLMINARINGLSHRDILISALAASHKSKKKTRKAWQTYRSLLSESDLQKALALGTLLRISAALDSGEDQPVERLDVRMEKKTLHLNLQCRRLPQIEIEEAEEYADDFKKIWGLSPEFHVQLSAKQ